MTDHQNKKSTTLESIKKNIFEEVYSKGNNSKRISSNKNHTNYKNQR